MLQLITDWAFYTLSSANTEMPLIVLKFANSIEPSASSLHNLGLIYYETENYQKAATAFEQSLLLEDSLAARHIAYAKVQEKIGNDKLVLQELEKATELEPNP